MGEVRLLFGVGKSHGQGSDWCGKSGRQWMRVVVCVTRLFRIESRCSGLACDPKLQHTKRNREYITISQKRQKTRFKFLVARRFFGLRPKRSSVNTKRISLQTWRKYRKLCVRSTQHGEEHIVSLKAEQIYVKLLYVTHRSIFNLACTKWQPFASLAKAQVQKDLSGDHRHSFEWGVCLLQ